jgi:ribonuclease R
MTPREAGSRRQPPSFVGILSRRGRFTVAEPLFERGRSATVDVRSRRELKVGDLVLVRARGRGRGARPFVERSLGRPDVARDVVEALLLERGHARFFDSRVEDEVATLGGDGAERRRDLTTLETFTIDPDDARDFDDAVSVTEDGDSLRLYVHIADVAAHVRPGSATDAEALARGNSVYVPGTVEPMLPELLSTHLCSLVPEAPRKAVTLEAKLSSLGAPASVSFYRSLIRSDARLTYREVESAFGGKARLPESVATQVALARRLAATLRSRRLGRGSLGLESSEPEFAFDSDGHVVDAIDDIQTEAHGVIEELMILANELVATELAERRRPTLYRVHEQPEPTAIEHLAAQLESLDVATPPLPARITPSAAGEAAAGLGRAVVEHVRRNGRGRAALTSLVLRSLKPAFYSPRNIGHAGLASPRYCHFTSPIRRYPDLVVHRALLAAVGGREEPAPAGELEEIGRHCSETERDAMFVERDADSICLAFLAERKLSERGWDEPLEGEVSGVIAAGAFVSFALDGTGSALFEGFLPARRLRGDFFELNEEATALVGRRTGRRLRLGDPVSVTVDSIDAPRGRVDLAPVAVDAGPSSAHSSLAARGSGARR